MAKVTVQQQADSGVSLRDLAWSDFSVNEARARLEDGELRLFCAPISLASAVSASWPDANTHLAYATARQWKSIKRYLVSSLG